MKKIINFCISILGLFIFFGMHIIIEDILNYYNINNKYISYVIHLVMTYIYIVMVIKFGEWIEKNKIK